MSEEADTENLIAAAAAQLVEHVDVDGNVIEVVTRSEMRARALRHRSVYIAVRDRDDRLLLHKRAGWKDVFPGAWDLAFGGVCDVGEDWSTSAHRELFEEAGIRGDLTDHGPVAFEAPDVALVGRLYSCVHDGPFEFNDGEVTDSQWIPLVQLDRFITEHDVPPDSAQIITRAALLQAAPDATDTASVNATTGTQEPHEPQNNRGTP